MESSGNHSHLTELAEPRKQVGLMATGDGVLEGALGTNTHLPWTLDSAVSIPRGPKHDESVNGNDIGSIPLLVNRNVVAIVGWGVSSAAH